MKIIDSIIAKRKLSDGRNVYCDRCTTGVIMEKSFTKGKNNEAVIGPMQVSLEGDLYVVEGSTDPTHGLMYLLLMTYNGSTGEIEEAVLVKDAYNPKFHLMPSALPQELVDVIQKNVKTFVMDMITNPSATPSKPADTIENYFPDLNQQPTPGVNPQWNGRVNI